jgi:hypothetical protein
MTVRKIEIGAEVGKGWRLFKANMGVLILGGLLATVVSVITCGLLTGPLMVGMLLIAQRLLKGDPDKPQAGDVFKGLDSFMQALLLMVITAVVVAVLRLLMAMGGLPVLIGGLVDLVVSVVTLWALVFIAYEKATAIDAIKKVFVLIKSGSFTVPLLFAMIAGLIGGLGMILCVVGIFFTMPLTYCLMACCYDTLFGDEPEAIDLTSTQTPPPSDLRL